MILQSGALLLGMKPDLTKFLLPRHEGMRANMHRHDAHYRNGDDLFYTTCVHFLQITHASLLMMVIATQGDMPCAKFLCCGLLTLRGRQQLPAGLGKQL